MTGISGVTANFNIKVGEGFWSRVACLLAGHKFEAKYLAGGPPVNGYLIGHRTYICVRCGKFRDYPYTFKQWMRRPFILREVL